ncbi:MAG TPA: alginate lyase family protein [Solirubrobacteraceae bacterium]|nr:alginate lyase family protein [Solirubrobacteraceae bacterium]
MRRLREGLAAWRRLGPRHGTAAVVTFATSYVRAPLRRARLRVRRLRVGPVELRRALGDRPAEGALRERALPALPTVAAWERELDELDAVARARLLEQAEQILAHRFDLLGSGLTELGASIDWQRDFKSGRRWPDVHISRVPTVLGGGSDIKVPWELSRCQHLPLLAAAHRVSDDRRFLDELGAQLSSFIAANPVEFGAPWSCTMDVAIRAANWVAALCIAMPAATDAPWLEPALASLLLHCRFIRGHLEWGEVRGNHYLSDVVGLLLACAPFSDSAEGRAWALWATAELEREMAHQVRADGCDHEASIPYHRLVAELFVCGTQAADALCPGVLSSVYSERLELMLTFVSDYARPDGLAPQVGDADDGRFLPLGTYGADPRDHRHLYAQAGRSWRDARTHAAYPSGGWYVMRHERLWAIVRCGDVGLEGIGAHAHNDQLSFELALGEQPLIVDPGSYLYTADARARNAFRSTRAHSTLSVGGAEQNRLRSDYLFTLPEESRARCVRFDPQGARAVFVGEHSGFHELGRPVRHRRELSFDGEGCVVTITDTVLGAAGEELTWSFPLAPGEASAEESHALASFAGAELEIRVEDAAVSIEEGVLAPSYGVRVPAPVVHVRRIAASDEDVMRFTLIARAPTGGRRS